LIKNISPAPPNARDDQPRTSVPQLSLRRSVNPPGRGPLHFSWLARGAARPGELGAGSWKKQLGVDSEARRHSPYII
jgi:hypothetical protein